jgi:hypothetical protein
VAGAHESVLRVADILSRRGQTIYGRQAIVDLCTSTGVALMSSRDVDMGPADSEESLRSFIVEYSKLSPAAKLTVQVLSRSYGIDMPAELLGKRKKGVAEILESLAEFTHDLTDRLRG